MAESPETAEERLIARHFQPMARHPGALGLVDDAAVLTPPAGCDLVLTKDAIVESVHFFSDDPPETIARKALRVNLSDLAAKGATPLGFLLAVALPQTVSEAWLHDFVAGLSSDAETYRCPLLGGDTVTTPGPLTISVTAFGSVPQGKIVRRAGAEIDDRVFVTGTIGDAALGLKLRQSGEVADRWKLTPEEAAHLIGRYRLPQPRNAFADAVRAHASAAMDVSDGLAGDLGKLCRASGASAQIFAPRIPLSQAAQRALASEPTLISTILSGGDDYEVLCTVPNRRCASFTGAAEVARVMVTEIGCIVGGTASPRFVDAKGAPLAFQQAAFSHF